MPIVLKVILGLLGAMLVAVAPYLWWKHAEMLWILIPLIGVWCFWLMTEYLRWARTLGKTEKN